MQNGDSRAPRIRRKLKPETIEEQAAIENTPPTPEVAEGARRMRAAAKEFMRQHHQNQLNKNLRVWLPLLLKPLNATCLVLPLFFNFEIGYFQVLRWFITASAVYYIYKCPKWQQPMYWIIGILFNPIKEFYFGRDTWHVLDIICAIAILISTSSEVRKIKTSPHLI